MVNNCIDPNPFLFCLLSLIQLDWLVGVMLHPKVELKSSLKDPGGVSAVPDGI